MFIHFLRSSATHRPIPVLVSKLLYAFAVFNSAISPFLYGYFSFNIRSELEQLCCCVLPCRSNNSANGINSTLAGWVFYSNDFSDSQYNYYTIKYGCYRRRRAIRQRGVNDHSLTNNSTTNGPLSPNAFSSVRNNTAVNSTVIESRTTRVRLSNASKTSKQTLSFDDESSSTAQVRRPSRLLVSPPLSTNLPKLTDSATNKHGFRTSPSNTSINEFKSNEAP
jgi:hypothetical protein